LNECDTAIPKKKWHYISVPWWTPELIRAKRNTYLARRRYKGDKDPKDNEGTRKAAVLGNQEAIYKHCNESKDPELTRFCNRGG
jgi:hypothetical protein